MCSLRIFFRKALIYDPARFSFSLSSLQYILQIVVPIFRSLLCSGYLSIFNSKLYFSRFSVSHIPVRSLLCSSTPFRCSCKADFTSSGTAVLPNIVCSLL